MQYHPIPDDYPVRPIAPDTGEAPATCGTCGLTWDDAIVTGMTPAPSARCPFEAFHVHEDDDAASFFYLHAGFGYHPGTETENEGRWRSARELAAAEEWAREVGLRFEWEDDWSVDHAAEFDCYDDDEPDTCEVCTARDADGSVVASLGCIDDATPAYRRVIEAELADEAWYAVRETEREAGWAEAAAFAGSL